MVGLEFVVNMKEGIHSDMHQWYIGVGNIFLGTLGFLIPTQGFSNTTAYLSDAADRVHPFNTTVYQSSEGYFQQEDVPRHNALIISGCSCKH